MVTGEEIKTPKRTVHNGDSSEVLKEDFNKNQGDYLEDRRVVWHKDRESVLKVNRTTEEEGGAEG